MADVQRLIRALMRAVAALRSAVAVIDNAPDGCPTCAKVRADLVQSLEASEEQASPVELGRAS